jgi:beta-hydroxylase
VRALQSLPNIDSAAFSRLAPGCHILPHVDRYFPGVVRAHLGLIVPPGARARIGSTYATWAEGKVLLFDGQIEHEVANLGPEPRTVLLADFVLTEEEQRVLERARAALA